MRNWNWLGVPDLRAVLSDSSIGRELSRFGNTDDGHLSPLSIVTISSVDCVLSVDVAIEVKAGDVVVTTVRQVVEDWVNDASISEEAGLDSVEHSLQSATNVVSLSIPHGLSAFRNSGDSLSEDEHVLFSEFFGNLDVGTVHGTDDESTVHDELHVGCS